MVRWPFAAEPFAAGLEHLAYLRDRGRHGRSSSNAAPVVFAITLASVVFPLPGGP